MARTNILSLVNNGLKSEGLPALSALYAGTDDAALILQQKCNDANRELAREWEWPQLLKKGTITLATGVSDYSFPSDFDAWVFDTTFNQNQLWDLGGPITPTDLQIRNYSFFNTLLWEKYIVIGAPVKFSVSPTPDASVNGNTISFYYMSTLRVYSSSGVTAPDLADFNADTNETLLDEDALRFRIMAHYFRSKGLEYQNLAAQALERSNERITAIRGAGTVYCSGRYGRTRFITYLNLPQTGWGV